MKLRDFQTVILAGGRGERLRPLTDHVPKPLVPVNGKPYLVWQIEELVRQGLGEILVLTGYRGEQIESTLGSGNEWGARISYSHETQPLGTAGALIQAEPKLEAAFLLLNGDSFLPMNFQAMIEVFEKTGVPMLVATYDNRIATSVPNNLQILGGRVVAYQKGAGLAQGFQAVDAGVYILDRRVLSLLKKEEHQLQRAEPPTVPPVRNLEMVWTQLMSEKKIGAFPVDRRFYDIGTLDRLREFEVELPTLVTCDEVVRTPARDQGELP